MRVLQHALDHREVLCWPRRADSDHDIVHGANVRQHAVHQHGHVSPCERQCVRVVQVREAQSRVVPGVNVPQGTVRAPQAGRFQEKRHFDVQLVVDVEQVLESDPDTVVPEAVTPQGASADGVRELVKVRHKRRVAFVAQRRVVAAVAGEERRWPAAKVQAVNQRPRLQRQLRVADNEDVLPRQSPLSRRQVKRMVSETGTRLRRHVPQSTTTVNVTTTVTVTVTATTTTTTATATQYRHAANPLSHDKVAARVPAVAFGSRKNKLGHHRRRA